MKKKHWSSIAAPVAATLMMVLCGCDSVEKNAEIDEIDLVEEESGLKQYGATLTAEISVQAWNSTAPKLCIGRSSQCHSLTTSSNCTTTGTTRECVFTWINTGDLPTDDRPFVVVADDWDKLYLLNNSSTRSLTVRGIRVNLVSGGFSYDFVNNFSLNETLAAKETFSLDTLIREKREAEVMAHTTGFGSFEDLPKMLQEAAYDIGQMGLQKYRPWDTTPQNGCDEFFNYFASHFSNNIYYSCSDSNIEECSYMKNWDQGYNAISAEQFFHAGRLYKFVFNNNVTSYSIQKCTSYPCTTTDSSKTYTVKAGDFFRKVQNGGSWHVMMSTGVMPTITRRNASQQQMALSIVDKNELVVARDRVFVLPNNDPSYLELLVGVVDNELGDGQTNAHSSNRGFDVTQQVILN